MDESALIRQAQEGHIDSYNALVLHYQQAAYNVAYRIMGEGDSAADATQDAFISAYKSIKKFRGGSFKSWLFRIVTNACYDELRRRKRRPQASLEATFVENESPNPAVISKTENPEQFTQRMELQQAIADCIQQLPETQRVVSILSDVQGFNYNEISEVVGVALGTVKSRLSRSRANLRECLQGFSELLPAEYRLRDATDA